MSEAPRPVAKRLLAAKLVMGTAAPVEIIASAQYAVTNGDVSASAHQLANMSDADPEVAAKLLKSWLQDSGVDLPTPAQAWTMVFDFYFAAAALGPSDPRDGIRDFLTNVVHPRRVLDPMNDDAEPRGS
jgi:hypothetical protein